MVILLQISPAVWGSLDALLWSRAARSYFLSKYLLTSGSEKVSLTNASGRACLIAGQQHHLTHQCAQGQEKINCALRLLFEGGSIAFVLHF